MIYILEIIMFQMLFLISTKGIIIESNLRGEKVNNRLKEILE